MMTTAKFDIAHGAGLCMRMFLWGNIRHDLRSQWDRQSSISMVEAGFRYMNHERKMRSRKIVNDYWKCRQVPYEIGKETIDSCPIKMLTGPFRLTTHRHVNHRLLRSCRGSWFSLNALAGTLTTLKSYRACEQLRWKELRNSNKQLQMQLTGG